MAHNINKAPDESLKEHFITRDGYLWWNPELAKYHPRRVIDKPIGITRNNKYPTVAVDGNMYHVHKLNYWMHTNEWPNAVAYKDQGFNNTHIDNLESSNFSVIRANATKTETLTYMIRQTTKKNGDIVFSPRMIINGKTLQIGTYSNEHEAIEAAKAMRWLVYRTDKMPDNIKRLINCIAVS